MASRSLADRVEARSGLLLGAVMLLAAVLRLAALAAFRHDLGWRVEYGFWYPAVNWIHGHGLSIAKDCPTSYRAPLYILFVIPFLAIFGEGKYVIPLGLAQAAVSTASVYLVYLIGREWKSERVGLLAALFMACYPYNLYHDTQFYITFLFTFFFLLAVLGLLRLERTGSTRTAILNGLWIGLAMLATSGPMVFIAPIACVWLWWRWKSFKKAFRAAAIMAVTALLVMAPWFIRNDRIHHAFVPLTTDAGRVFYKAYNPWALQMLLHDIHVDATPEPGDGVLTPMNGIGQTGCEFLGMTELENEHYWYDVAWKWIRQHPGQVPVLMFVKFSQLWRPWMWTPKNAVGDNGAVILSAAFMDWGYALTYGFLIALGAFEWLVSTKQERGRAWLFVILAIAFSLTYSITYAFTKYRVPFDSALAVLSAAGVWRFIEAWQARQKNGIAASTGGGAPHA